MTIKIILGAQWGMSPALLPLSSLFVHAPPIPAIARDAIEEPHRAN